MLIFFNALINALLMHPGQSKESRGKVTLGPATFGEPTCKIYTVKKQIKTHFSTITDVIASIEIY